MVLELLFNPFSLKKRPWEVFLVGFLYSVVALVLSFLVFREAAGLLAVFLIVISTLPILYTLIKNEEELDLKSEREWVLLKEHTKILIFLMFLFFGITLALVLSYVFLPQHIVDSIFGLQQQAIVNVNRAVQAEITGNLAKIGLFGNIFLNNLKVLFFCIVFAFLYGTGAIFILTWNASVVATAIGNVIKTELASAASSVGYVSLSTYFSAATFGFFRYMTHGIAEMASYFVAGLAGGIISIALIKHNLKEDRILIDALHLILISLGLLVLAGFIEVYITPLIAY